jgi:hypothetical protein
MMKKLMISLMFMLAISVSASALNNTDARSIARFLTDKMAYELNLTNEQYEAAYEINYDYFLNLSDYNDLYGSYWTRRNLDLSYILGSTKYSRFKNMFYFYKPAYWNSNRFRYRIYSRYSNRSKYYFSQPSDYSNYNGEHSWKQNSGQSYYKGKNFNSGSGMRSNMRQGNSNNNNSSRVSGNNRMNNNRNVNNNSDNNRNRNNNGNENIGNNNRRSMNTGNQNTGNQNSGNQNSGNQNSMEKGNSQNGHHSQNMNGGESDRQNN